MVVVGVVVVEGPRRGGLGREINGVAEIFYRRVSGTVKVTCGNYRAAVETAASNVKLPPPPHPFLFFLFYTSPSVIFQRKRTIAPHPHGAIV